MDLFRILDEFQAGGDDACALATVVETHGSTYRRAGARLLIRGDRKTWGSISGGCVESDVILRAMTVIRDREAALVRYTPAEDDLLFGFGSGCGGEIAVAIEPIGAERLAELRQQLLAASPEHAAITVYQDADPSRLGTSIGLASSASPGAFVEPVVTPLSLFIFGASPAAEPLIAVAKQLGWRVAVADHRPSAATDPRLAGADQVEIGPAEELPSRFAYRSPSAAVVMTHHYGRDLELARQLLDRPVDYLGIVGSRERTARMTADLLAGGASQQALASMLFAPAGLDLRGDAPPEIALSIAAEIQAVSRRATASSLRWREGAIHGLHDENAVLVLAAGGSRRLGSPKQLAQVDGESLVRKAAQAALASGAGSVHVVLGAHADRIRAELSGLPLHVVENDEWQEGIASSIRTGMASVERLGRPVESVTVMLCDQPGVSGEYLRRLLAVYRAMSTPVVAARYPEGAGVPAIFHAQLFPALKDLRGDTGARQLLRRFDREIVTIPFAALHDVDTPDDLARVRSR